MLGGVLGVLLGTCIVTTGVVVTALAFLAFGLTAIWISIVGPVLFVVLSGMLLFLFHDCCSHESICRLVLN